MPKMTDDQILKLADQIRCARAIKPIVKWAKDSYDKAMYIMLDYDSVYNDETYDDEITAVHVYDKNKVELTDEDNNETYGMFEYNEDLVFDEMISIKSLEKQMNRKK